MDESTIRLILLLKSSRLAVLLVSLFSRTIISSDQLKNVILHHGSVKQPSRATVTSQPGWGRDLAQPQLRSVRGPGIKALGGFWVFILGVDRFVGK